MSNLIKTFFFLFFFMWLYQNSFAEEVGNIGKNQIKLLKKKLARRDKKSSFNVGLTPDTTLAQPNLNGMLMIGTGIHFHSLMIPQAHEFKQAYSLNFGGFFNQKNRFCWVWGLGYVGQEYTILKSKMNAGYQIELVNKANMFGSLGVSYFIINHERLKLYLKALVGGIVYDSMEKLPASGFKVYANLTSGISYSWGNETGVYLEFGFSNFQFTTIGLVF